MADFIRAYDEKTMPNELGYSNDPDDSGGETWRGIARNKNPHSPIWPIVDSYKGQQNFIRNLEKDEALQDLVLQEFKSDYWDMVWGDDILDQDIAAQLYDTAVNVGVSAAIRDEQAAAGQKTTGVMDTQLLNYLNALS